MFMDLFPKQDSNAKPVLRLVNIVNVSFFY